MDISILTMKKNSRDLFTPLRSKFGIPASAGLKIFRIALMVSLKLIFKKLPENLNLEFHLVKTLKILWHGEFNRLKNQRKLKLSIPHTCFLSVTWRCNLSCLGCYASNYPDEDQLTLPEIDKIIKEAQNLGTYTRIINTMGVLKKHKMLFGISTRLFLKKTENISPSIST